MFLIRKYAVYMWLAAFHKRLIELQKVGGGSLKITIVGAGNVGTHIAVHCAEKGNEVIIFSSKYKQIKKRTFYS